MMNASRMAAIVLVVLLLTAYPLSYGPVLRMHLTAGTGGGVPFSRAELAFYTPLRWARSIKPVEKAMQSYTQLWIPGDRSFVDY